MRDALRTAMIAGVALALGGCSLGLTQDPPASLLTLEPDVSVPAGTVFQPGDGANVRTISIYTPTTPAKLDVLRVPVAINANEIAYLQEAVWVEKPSRLFRQLLSETLRASGPVMVINGDETPVRPQERLRGRLLDMGYDAQASAVVVRFDAMRADAKGNLIETRRFEARESNVAPEVAAVGPALNRAANQVAGEVTRWITGTAIVPDAPPIMDEPAS